MLEFGDVGVVGKDASEGISSGRGAEAVAAKRGVEVEMYLAEIGTHGRIRGRRAERWMIVREIIVAIVVDMGAEKC